ncbi:alpha/beta hydrolase family protein [Teredinibacter sp. KSP-S5-2]|uniref:alpha/beta hydrolase family protein n=1 Tax=Teredinibacter sp. KSP-S5-2 TaxID=3034506 RepID=UPI0029345B68|nr:alpha/beta fold hydrolase [Teredinibacter sp. KSP-S5-2]WNO07759.1 alpha/beta fold hydrolase [Teredinibacter sp. KSP-S5-2]
MFSHLKKLLLVPIGILAACSNSFDNMIISLVPRPQAPKERPYQIREIEFNNPQDGIKIAGELTYPSTGNDFPAFVLISGHEDGASPANRNSEITGHKYFLVISDLLTKRGYAVLRFDNRGVGKSSGDYTTASDDEFASDAAAALKWLREESNIPLSLTGFLGHSQGGVKALLAASHEKPDFIVALAGLGVETSTELFVRQNQTLNKHEGMNQTQIDQMCREITDIIAILQNSNTLNEARENIREYAVNSGVDNEKNIQNLVNHFATNWWYKEVRRDPIALLKSYDGPILSLFGSKDLLVSSSINEAPVRKLLINPQSEALTYDGLNHLFQTAKKGTGPYEYWEIETTIEEKVVDKIDSWTKSIIHSSI